MTAQEFRATMYLCRGFSGYDIANICESCLCEIEGKAVFEDGEP